MASEAPIAEYGRTIGAHSMALWPAILSPVVDARLVAAVTSSMYHGHVEDPLERAEIQLSSFYHVNIQRHVAIQWVCTEDEVETRFEPTKAPVR